MLSGGRITGVSGVGLGWRPELAWQIQRNAQRLGFTEVIAEIADAHTDSLKSLRDRGVSVIPHGVTLSLGSAELPETWRIERLATLAQELDAPFVSEHVAFVRAGGIEAGHLLPVPRTREMLEVMIENVAHAKAQLPVPLVLENAAALFEWPGAEMDEAAFLSELLERSDTGLLLDVSNVHANAFNHGWDAVRFLESLPLERLVYVHVAGGYEKDGLFHDTHAHPIRDESLALLRALVERIDTPPPVLLERDRNFGRIQNLWAELDSVAEARMGGRHVA